jgi:hypothetical protein
MVLQATQRLALSDGSLDTNNTKEHRSIETMCDAIINLIAFIREVIQWLVLSKQWKMWMHSDESRS